MALTETTVEDKIEVVGDHKHVQVRTATVIARRWHRDQQIIPSSRLSLLN